MKRIISLITALTMLLTLIVCNVPSAFAAKEQLEFVLTNGAGLNNEEFTIELQLQNNPGIYAYYLMLYYDTDVFILRDYELADEYAKIGSLITSDANLPADSFNGAVGQRIVESFPSFGVDATDKSMILLEYEIDDVSKNCELNGTSIYLTFQVMGIAEAGDYTIGLVPDTESIINVDAEDVPFKMTNSIVRVGTTEAPAETAPTQSYKDTVKVDTTAETTANDIIVLDPDEEETIPNNDVVTAPEETFQGDDGKIYYENEAGETVEYKEEDFATTAPSDSEDTTKADISVDGEETTGENDKGNNMILYIVIAAILVLVAVAGILIVFISKAKKEGTVEEAVEEKNDEE